MRKSLTFFCRGRTRAPSGHPLAIEPGARVHIALVCNDTRSGIQPHVPSSPSPEVPAPVSRRRTLPPSLPRLHGKMDVIPVLVERARIEVGLPALIAPKLHPRAVQLHPQYLDAVAPRRGRDSANGVHRGRQYTNHGFRDHPRADGCPDRKRGHGHACLAGEAASMMRMRPAAPRPPPGRSTRWPRSSSLRAA